MIVSILEYKLRLDQAIVSGDADVFEPLRLPVSYLFRVLIACLLRCGGDLAEPRRCSLYSLRVWDDRENDIFLALDLEVKTPSPCHSVAPQLEMEKAFVR